MQRFAGKTILVTGAGSGIGAATVRRLFAEGASIVAADVRQDAVDTVVAACGGSVVVGRHFVCGICSHLPSTGSRCAGFPSRSRQPLRYVPTCR